MTKAVALVIISGLAVAALLFIVLRGGGGGSTSTSTSTSALPTVPDADGTVTKASGLKYVDEVEGAGASPRQGQNITVHYTGTLQNGTKFDSSVDRGQPLKFRLGIDPMIKGWDEGVMTMKVGGKRKLIIPPNLAYGAAGRSGIPPNATLIFEMELLGVE